MKNEKLFYIITILVISTVSITIGANLTIFEDGSFWLFDWSGCLPFNLCN